MITELVALLIAAVREFGAWGIVGAMVSTALILSARGIIHWAAACNLRIAFLEAELAEVKIDRAYWKAEALAERDSHTQAVVTAEVAAQ